jgi:uncharacterized linocin/CFP29 family protein
MANKYLGRDDAPFDEDLWAMLDAAMTAAAKSQLAGRRILHIEGPYGLGLKTVPMPDFHVDITWRELAATEGLAASEAQDVELEESAYPTEVFASGVIPVPLIRTGFTLAKRDLASYERDGVALDLSGVAEAAMACASAEDDLIFGGSDMLGTYGLLNVPGNHTLKVSGWKKPGEAADDIIKALTALDDGGLHGPYTLALAPARFNLLYRRYPQGNQTELGHLQGIITEGVIKAPTLQEGGVLLASGDHFASIVLGQDMTIGFIGPVGADFEFSISESLAVRIRQPRAICVLQG